MKDYRHIFFDLDRTLWDFNKNSHETLQEIHLDFGLMESHGIDFAKFMKAYMKINDHLWENYRKNKVTKESLREQRFFETLRILGVPDNKLANSISDHYLEHCPKKKHLIPFVEDILLYLSEKYHLHIITNGFSEAQRVKLQNTGIDHYFRNVFISEEIGHKKPSRKIFDSAIGLVNGKAHESLMIGDDLRVDIRGAAGAGMDQVYYNPERKLHRYKKITYQVSCLSELRTIL